MVNGHSVEQCKHQIVSFKEENRDREIKAIIKANKWHFYAQRINFVYTHIK